MTTLSKLGLVLSMILATMGFFAHNARAEFISTLSPNVEHQSDDTYLYTYILSIDSSSSIPATSLAISVSASADLTAIAGPTGWDITYTPGDSSISWSASDFPFALLSGTDASFSFVSALPPAFGDYSVTGINIDDFSIGSNSGSTQSPVAEAVPEPVSLIQLGIGFIALAGLTRRRCK